MNENAWEGLDPEIRAQAADAAAALGMSLEDYLGELLLEQTLETMLQEPTPEPEPPPEPLRVPSFATSIGKSRENSAVRQRLDALERRIALAVGSLNDAINTVDGSLVSLAERVEENEAAYGGAAESLSQALTELSGNLGAVRAQIAAAEGGLSALNSANTAMHAELAEKYTDLDQRLNVVDDIARDADRAAAELARAQERLKQAVADDFCTFAQETTHRIGADLDELRNAAVAAACHADDAAAHVMSELRALREGVESRMAESAAETQARMQAAFADSAALYTALYSRVTDHERITGQTAEQVHVRLIDIEDAAQTALEETAEGLRAAHAALAVDLARVSQDGRAAVEMLRSDMSCDLAELRDGQAGAQARLGLVESAVANAIGDLATLHESIDRRVANTSAMARAELAHARDSWSNRFDSLAARLTDSESDTARAHHIAIAEINRVEACTLAALEKGAQDRGAGEATLRREIGEATQAAQRHVEDVRQRMQHEVAALRGHQAGAQARVDAIAATLAGDGQVGAVLKRLPALEAKLARIESALVADQTEVALSELREQLNSVAVRFGGGAGESVLARIEDARARIAAQEARAAEAADRMQGLALLLSRLSAQNSGAAEQAEGRLHGLELALSDLQRERSAAEAQASASSGLVARLGARLAEMEQRQANALEQLRADIAQFLDENDGRLAALEHRSDGSELSEEFQALRQRVEERLVEAERKSVRALEQVMETVALIGRKLSEDSRAPAAKTA